jgi:signal peptidase II
MIAIATTVLGVLAADLALKLLLDRVTGSGLIGLGPFGQLRIVPGRLWLRQLCGHSTCLTMWTLWVAAAGVLVIASRWLPSSAVFVGLLLGGSLSNVVEISRRGTVSDYVCLRFWPAFNLADVALATGAVGILISLLFAVLATAP